MTCNEIEKRIFYGPVTIKSNKCQQSFVFDIECQKKNALRINSTVCDDSNFKIAFVLTMSILVLVLTALLILLLWVIGLQRGILIKGRKVKLQREGCYYTVHYSEYINENGEKEFMLGSEPSIVNMEHKVVRKHWCLLLLLFLICKPLKVTGYELMESYDSTKLKYNYKIVLGDSEQINFGSGTITREVVIHTSNLAHLFDTASWKLNIKEEYFCQWYKCEALSVCGMGTLPFIQVGDLAKELFGFKLSERAFYTCQKLIGYCTFGNGCKLIAFEVVPDTTSKRSVYSMTAGGSHGGEVKPPVGCIVDSVIDKSAGLLESHLLVTGENNESYICNRDLFSAKPEMGMLGDLQLMREGRMHFATREIGCVADYNNRAICRYGGSFIENIDSHCEKTSHLPFKVDVNTLDHTFSWKMSGEAVVSLRCDRRIPLRQTTGVCTDIEVKVWEVAHLDSQLLLGFVANSLNGESVFKFPKLVHMHSHSFTCDSIQQYSELYDLKSLKTLGINYTLETIPFNSLDALQEDHFSNSDPEIDRGVTIVERVINNLPFWGLSSTALIVLLAIAILCMMRR